MVVCFGDHTKPDGFVDDYSIKSTLNSIKSLIYRLDTPYMSNKAKSSQHLYDAIRPVIETQGKLFGPNWTQNKWIKTDPIKKWTERQKSKNIFSAKYWTCLQRFDEIMAKLMPQNSEVNCDLIALSDFD